MGSAIKTTFLLTLAAALFLGIGYLFGGEAGMTIALVLAGIFNFGTYWFSDKIVLAAHRARPIGPGDPSGVDEIISDLCLKANMPKPKIYIVPSNVPNAFATGRNPHHAAVAVTEGILKVLDKRELRGVLAHELSHVRNRDILVSTIVATFAAAVMYLSRMMQWMTFLGGGRGGVEAGGHAVHQGMALRENPRSRNHRMKSTDPREPALQTPEGGLFRREGILRADGIRTRRHGRTPHTQSGRGPRGAPASTENQVFGRSRSRHMR